MKLAILDNFFRRTADNSVTQVLLNILMLLLCMQFFFYYFIPQLQLYL